jgi:fructose-bisphosphate aldolase class 1
VKSELGRLTHGSHEEEQTDDGKYVLVYVRRQAEDCRVIKVTKGSKDGKEGNAQERITDTVDHHSLDRSLISLDTRESEVDQKV